jgi:hypothetical protein
MGIVWPQGATVVRDHSEAVTVGMADLTALARVGGGLRSLHGSWLRTNDVPTRFACRVSGGDDAHALYIEPLALN